MGNYILFRGVDGNQRVSQKVLYKPSLFVPTNKETKYRTLDGRGVEKITFPNMREARNFLDRYENVENFEIYGNNRFIYPFISDNFSGSVDYDETKIITANIDIEVSSKNGMPDPAVAREEITAITFKVRGKYFVYGLKPYNNTRDDVYYVMCDDESDLLRKFLSNWQRVSPDILTGWNVQYFDVPYLVNRITNVLGEKEAKRLSPWGMFSRRKVRMMNRELEAITIVGISILDYIELYKKYAPKANQPTYKLNYIAHVELGEEKLDYSEYSSLDDLYENDFQKFIDYNIKDVDLVDKLEEKMQLLSMVISVAYDAKVNYNDVFTQVRMWDSIIFNHLKESNIVIPQMSRSSKGETYAGAFVKDPKVGAHDWVVSFDLNSLYPNLIAWANISPETIVSDIHKPMNIDDILQKKYDLEYLKDQDLAIAASGAHFKRDQLGFLPKILMRMYDDRVLAKDKMLEAMQEMTVVEKQISECSTKELITKRKELYYRISKYKNLQLAKKVQLNSAYGALGNSYFRFYDVRQAEAITLSGQLVIRWIEKAINQYLNKLLETENEDYIIAIDTDSVYITFGAIVDKFLKSKKPDITKKEIVKFLDKFGSQKIEKFIDSSYEELKQYMNSYRQSMKMKRESIADKGIWTAKKRYILNEWVNENVWHNEPKLKTVGVECVRSNTPEVCRTNIETALEIIMNGDEESLKKFVTKFEQEFSKLTVYDISRPSGVNGIEKYKDSQNIYKGRTPYHVKGSLVYNHLLKKHKLESKHNPIRDGDKIRVVYLREPNPSLVNVISFIDVLPQEFNLEQYVDYDMQFNKTFIDPLGVILKVIGWSSKEENSLYDLFE